MTKSNFMETKSVNNNTSLSSRIKRRNKQGFLGIGNYNGCLDVKNRVYENINNPKLNHKEEDKNCEQQYLINKARKYGCNHPGSKTLKQLKHLYV